MGGSMKKLVLLLALLGILLIGNVLALTSYQNVTVNILPGDIEVYSPVQDNFYDNRMVLINLSMSANVSYFKYADNGDGKLVSLCRKCDSYSKKKPFDDGFHELKILAIFDSGTITKYINFRVDSKKPIIKKTEPVKGFTSGFFEVEFQEENPVSLILHYGDSNPGMREQAVDLEACQNYKNRKICQINVDLTDYDGQEIEYWFNITDVFGRSDESKGKKVEVDLSNPIINYFDYSIKGRYATLNMSIDEKNFNSVEYRDLNSSKPLWRTLCPTLKEGICKKKKSFRLGEHNLQINISDDARHSVIETAQFNIL